MNTSDVTIESKINVPFDTLIKALVEAHVNISINSLITALTNANVNIINEKSVDISKNIPVVLKTEIANDIEPKNNYVDASTGVSPPSTEIVEDNSYLLSSIPQEQSINNDDFSNVIEEALKYIKNRQEPLVEVEEPLVEPLVEVEEQVVEPKEDKPSESIKKPVIEIPSPKAFEPLPEIPPTPRAIQSRVYYQPYLIPRPPPPPPQILHYHHYIIQPIIQPIIQYIPQPVQYLMQQFRPAYR